MNSSHPLINAIITAIFRHPHTQKKNKNIPSFSVSRYYTVYTKPHNFIFTQIPCTDTHMAIHIWRTVKAPNGIKQFRKIGKERNDNKCWREFVQNFFFLYFNEKEYYLSCEWRENFTRRHETQPIWYINTHDSITQTIWFNPKLYGIIS